jgi:hypothetical protein
MTPCHGFGGIIQQWKSSTHYAVYVRELGGEEVATWTDPTRGCGNCHAIDGVELRVAGKLGTTGGTVTNGKTGQLNYKDSANKVLEANYAGTSKVASVYCSTCHTIDATNDPHKTGKNYTKGGFALHVPASANDEATLEKSATAGTVSGQGAGKLGAGNLCVWCHKSRKDVTHFIGATNALSNAYWGPHEGPHADVMSGKGGYHYAGKSYGSTAAHLGADGCVTCHMPTVAANASYVDHSFRANLEVCKKCHSGATSFDVNGGQTTVVKGIVELQAALNTAGYLTRGTTAGSPALSATELGKDFKLDKPRFQTPPVSVNADTAGALYNYFIVSRGGARGPHNPRYIKQLLWDSIAFLKGANPTFITARP